MTRPITIVWTDERKKEFAEQYYAEVPSEQREKFFQVGKNRLRELELAFGLRSPGGHSRACPQDFKEVYAKIGSVAARTYYRTGWSTIVRWCIENGLREEVSQNKIPDDWAQVAPTLTHAELRRKYRLSPYRLSILIAQTGVDPLPLPGRRPPRPKDPAIPAPPPKVIAKPVDPERAGKAAHHLRRHYSAVHRCDLRMYTGRNTVWADVQAPPIPNHGIGYYWVAGKGAILNADMIDLAITKGFRG
jgi:hypothetical protein